MTEHTYKETSEIFALVSSFEDATIARDVWRHAEHLVVALYYVDAHDEEDAIERMRSGILNLLTAGFGVDLAKEMPYHETLTVFWIRTVAEFNRTRKDTPIGDRVAELLGMYDKNYPFKFYSRERLFSEDARAAYVVPDRIPTELATVN